MTRGQDSSGGMPIYRMPGHLIRRLAQMHTSIFTKAAAEMGYNLTSVQYAALKGVECYPGIDQATLAGAIAYDRTTIGGVIDRLEKKVFLKRSPRPNDRRAHQLFLCAAGERALRDLDAIIDHVQETLLRGLTKKERELFLALLVKAADGANEFSRAPLKPVQPT